MELAPSELRRCIRALRALRVIKNNTTVRIVMSTLLNAASPIGICMLLVWDGQ
jgi:hypothetical protein